MKRALFLLALATAARADFVVKVPFAVSGLVDSGAFGLCTSRFSVGSAFVVTDPVGSCSQVFDPSWDVDPLQTPLIGWFGDVAAHLTNGVDEQVSGGILSLNIGGGSGGSFHTPESALFAGIPRTGPDLAGYSIQRIALDTSGITLTPLPDVSGFQVGGHAEFDITATSAVPEPVDAIVLMPCALLAIALAYRARRKHNPLIDAD